MARTLLHRARPASRHHDEEANLRHRRRVVTTAIVAGFLGVYLLGVSWVAEQLGTDMQRSLQVAPAAQDIAHR